MPKYTKILTDIAATCFFIGRIKWAPGTWGSLLAFPAIYIIDYLIVKGALLLQVEGWSPIEERFLTIFLSIFITIIVLFFIGIVVSNLYMKQHGDFHDPKEIVIDELVGQMLTSALTMISVVFVYNADFGEIYQSWAIDLTCFFILPFILFRACDIFKPWPINWIDSNIKGGLGVMLDDVAAAIMASVLQYAIIFAAIA